MRVQLTKASLKTNTVLIAFLISLHHNQRWISSKMRDSYTKYSAVSTTTRKIYCRCKTSYFSTTLWQWLRHRDITSRKLIRSQLIPCRSKFNAKSTQPMNPSVKAIIVSKSKNWPIRMSWDLPRANSSMVTSALFIQNACMRIFTCQLRIATNYKTVTI